MNDLTSATRMILWNIPVRWPMYAMFIISLIIFGIGVHKRMLFWLRGKRANERLTDISSRFLVMVSEFFFQKKLNQVRYPAIFHSFFFYSFLVLIFVTIVVSLAHSSENSFFNGWVYAFCTVSSDIAGIFILIGTLMAALRRCRQKPEALTMGLNDIFVLIFLALIVITGFLVEGIRIASTNDPWQVLSPIGSLVSFLFVDFDSPSLLKVHFGFWWFHCILVFLWIAIIPYSKLFHLLTLPANAFFSKIKPAGELNRFDIEALLLKDEIDDEFNIGVGTTKDLTWKQRLDLDACVSCGRCETVCPAFTVGQSLSPRVLIQNLKRLTIQSDNSGTDSAIEIVGNAFDKEFQWLCRTCMACTCVCPAYINHVDTLLEIRRNEVSMKGHISEDIRYTLKMQEKNSNPFGTQQQRKKWIKDLDAPVCDAGDSCDILYWIGCLVTFDEQKQHIAQDLIRILESCEINFKILGSEEFCCGDPARILGDEHIFQTVAKKQVAALNQRSFGKILTSCPHCYNVLKHEYPQFGGKYKILHHSQFLNDLIRQGKLEPGDTSRSGITYHDPCYLGRYQNILDAPRQIIQNQSNTYTEMDNSQIDSFCCGGGGGHFWMDLQKGERINTLRIQQAQKTGASTIVTGCPFCLHMLEDGIKTLNLDDKIRVLDISNLFKIETKSG